MASDPKRHTRIVLGWCDDCGEAQLIVFKPQPGEFTMAVPALAVDQERSIALPPEALAALRAVVDRFLLLDRYDRLVKLTGGQVGGR